MYQIHLEALALQVSIGCYAHEKLMRQSLRLDVTLNIDAAHSVGTDQLTDTIDYDALSQALCEIAQSQHFNLIETLTHTLVDYIQKQHPGALHSLKLSKPNALSNAKNVACEYRQF